MEVNDVFNIKWDKVSRIEPSKICGRQPLKKFTWSILEYFVPNVLTPENFCNTIWKSLIPKVFRFNSILYDKLFFPVFNNPVSASEEK